jgi:hypothetical protein
MPRQGPGERAAGEACKASVSDRVDQRDDPSAKLLTGLDGAHGFDGLAAARTNAVA